MNTMLSSEVWQDIQGYSGIYQVSTLGRIRSLKKGKIKLLKPYINNMGYAVLSLYANHKQKTYHVHKLVAETFLVKVDGKNYIDHINGIKTDNRIDNLRWCTPKENANFDLSIINRKRAMRKACGVSVNQYDLSGNYIATYATLTMLKLLQELHIKIYVHVVLVGIKQPEIIFGNLINKLNYESKSKRW